MTEKQRTFTCEVCREEFEATYCVSRVIRCPECRRKKRKGKSEGQAPGAAEIAARAKAAGMSYGTYVSKFGL